MYKIGHKKRYTRHHLTVLLTLLLLVAGFTTSLIWLLSSNSGQTKIKQAASSTQVFDPGNTKNNLKINNDLYTMELPYDWKQLEVNRDTRYNSIRWQMNSGSKNRWIELYTDRVPTDQAFNKIIPITVTNDDITVESVSDNCAKFTTFQSESDLKVKSKWQDAIFLCDLSNKNDNIVGVSDRTSGTTLKLTGPLKGTHTYMFVYTDRGIPEDSKPIALALETLRPK